MEEGKGIMFRSVSTSPSKCEKQCQKNGRIPMFLMGLVILGLITTNLATLLNEQVHSAAFNGLRGILAAILTEAALSSVIDRSPTVRRRHDVNKATLDLNDRNRKLVASTGVLQKKHDELARSYKYLDAKHRDLDAKHQALRTQFSAHKGKVADVSKRIAQRTVTNATRNTASLAGEAIPIVGTTLILAVTALDIKDACEAMKDSHELNALVGNPPPVATDYCGYTTPSKDALLAKMKENWRSAYKSAANAINKAGETMVPTNPQSPSWDAVKGPVCATLGRVPVICP